jgi:hypothetical protein
MSVVTDLILAVPIGIIYNMIIHELSVILNDNFSYKDKIQRNLLMIFGGGLLGFVLAIFFLSNSNQNIAIKYGLYLGSSLLLFHSVINNWQVMHNDTRIIIMILTLCVLIWYSYSSKASIKKKDDKKDKKNKKHNKDKSTDYKEKTTTHKLSSILPMTYFEDYYNSNNNDDDNGNNGNNDDDMTDDDLDEIVDN